MRCLRATRFIEALPEGGSLPAVFEAEDGRSYVTKFRGAAQGLKVLVAEIVAGEIARALELPVPEVVLIHLEPVLAGPELDGVMHDLLAASTGINVGLEYVPGALTFAASEDRMVEELLASRIVWFDAFVMNVDRTARNTNLLLKEDRPILIDHGAALYAHFKWEGFLAKSADPFPQIDQHVLLRRAERLEEADRFARSRLPDAVVEAVTALIPADLVSGEADIQDVRNTYGRFLRERVRASQTFVKEVHDVRRRSL